MVGFHSVLGNYHHFSAWIRKCSQQFNVMHFYLLFELPFNPQKGKVFWFNSIISKNVIILLIYWSKLSRWVDPVIYSAKNTISLIIIFFSMDSWICFSSLEILVVFEIYLYFDKFDKFDKFSSFHPDKSIILFSFHSCTGVFSAPHRVLAPCWSPRVVYVQWFTVFRKRRTSDPLLCASTDNMKVHNNTDVYGD